MLEKKEEITLLALLDTQMLEKQHFLIILPGQKNLKPINYLQPWIQLLEGI